MTATPFASDGGSQRIIFDGLNLSLARGTGIATYTRMLTRAAHDLGHEVGVLYSTPFTPAKDRLLREIAFFDATDAAPVPITREVQIANTARTENGIFVVIEGMNARPKAPRCERKQPATGAHVHEAHAAQAVAAEQSAQRLLRFGNLAISQAVRKVEPVLAEGESLIIFFLVQHYPYDLARAGRTKHYEVAPAMATR